MKIQRLFAGASVAGNASRFVVCILAGVLTLIAAENPKASRPPAAGEIPGASARAGQPSRPAGHGIVAALPATVRTGPDTQKAQARVAESYGKLPLSFERNLGQTDPRVKFLSRGSGYTLFLTGDEAVLSLRSQKSGVRSQKGGSRQSSVVSHQLQDANTKDNGQGTNDVFRMKLVGANRDAEATALEELPGKANYFIGNDPTKWRTNVPTFARVLYKGVYPGVDLTYYGNQRQLEYDFVVSPGADPKAILLQLEIGNWKLENGESKLDSRVRGNDVHPRESRDRNSKIALDQNGDLVIATEGGEVRFHKPIVYQQESGVRNQESGVRSQKSEEERTAKDNGQRTRDLRRNSEFKIQNSELVSGRFVLLADNRVGFEVGAYDRSKPLIIDPVLSYSTYLGGFAPGTAGTGLDMGNAIAVSGDGSAFVVGETDSTDFPTVHALQPDAGGPVDIPDDAFVSKISPDGSTLFYSTFLGGKNQDRANGIAVDSFGNAYVIGTTFSEDFPHSEGVFDPNCGVDGHCNSTLFGGLLTFDAFITKLNPAGSAIVYSGFLGGAGNTLGFGIAVDVSGNAYVTGTTDASAQWPASGGTLNGFQTVFGGGVKDSFVVKVSSTGSTLPYVSYLGGSDEDQGFGIAADNSGNAYVTGITFSADFPIPAYLGALTPFQGTNNGAGDAFVIKVNTNDLSGATSLLYSTFLGGDGKDQGNGITLDTTAHAYVTGVTNSPSPGTSFPTTGGVFQPACALDSLGVCEGDAFVAKVDPTQSGALSLIYSTYFGGSGADTGNAIAVDTSGNAYIAGYTNSTQSSTPAAFPTLGGPQSTYGGGNTDAFVTKLNPTATALVYSSFLGGSDADLGKGIAVDLFGSAYVTGQTCSTNFPTKRPLQAAQAGNCDAFVAKIRVGPDIQISPINLDFSAQAVGTSGVQTVTITSVGESALTISNTPSISIQGVDAAQFTLQNDSCSGASLSPDQTCSFQVAFTPTSLGPKTASVLITDNVDSGTNLVSLTGTGGALGVSPRSINFPDQGVGTTGSAVAVTMSNVGTTGINITSIATTGDFSQSNQCTTAINNILQPGANCTIDVTFSPTAIGTRTGTLTITDSDPTSPQIVSLNGNGTAPAVSLAPLALSFPSTSVGVASAAQLVTFTNTGNSILLISNIATTGDFAETNPCGAFLVAGGSCTISVTFTPTAVGNRYGTLTVTDNAEGSPQTVVLAGSGLAVPAATLSPTSLTFSDQPVNTTSNPQSVILTNTGGAALNITSVTVTGLNAADFSKAADQCSGTTVQPGLSCSFSVTFTPTASGARLASVTIVDNASNSPQTVPLTGNGILLPAVTLSTNSLTFPQEPVGTSAPTQNVTLTNSGGATLNITGITTLGDFSQTNTCGASVPAGSNCIITVTFTPSAPGTRSGVISIADNAPNSPQTITLSGGATAAPAVSLSTSSLTFPSEPPGVTSPVQTVTLNNTGTASLTISSVTITGQFAETTTCGTSVPAGGNCTFSITFKPVAAGTSSGTLTITDNAPGSPHIVTLGGSGSDFNLSISPTSNTILAGAAANYSLSVNPLFGFNGKVTFACTGAPSQATCSFSPSTITPDGTNPAVLSFIVSTTARAVAPHAGPWGRFPDVGLRSVPWLTWLMAISLLGLLVAARKRPKLILAALMLAVMLWAACGGGTAAGVPTGTPPGTYSLTITATSGSESHTTTVSLTVD